MTALISLIHEREVSAFEMLARGPCEVVILVENTSTHYISRDLYRMHNGPHVREFVDVVHAQGKLALVHMCGHMLDILEDIRRTGLDGVHALTPPPTGNTPWETALDILGDDTVLIGALDPSIFITGPVEGIPAALDALYTPRLRRSHFVLCPFADGIPVPLERFEAVSRWMQRNGR
jgi:uroporphyrinogen-III decarboxylase